MSNDVNGYKRLLYKANEAAQILGLSVKSVYRLCDRGLLDYSKALRHKMITAASIERFVGGDGKPKAVRGANEVALTE